MRYLESSDALIVMDSLNDSASSPLGDLQVSPILVNLIIDQPVAMFMRFLSADVRCSVACTNAE